jgi:hypothetical protein
MRMVIITVLVPIQLIPDMYAMQWLEVVLTHLDWDIIIMK